MVVFSMRVCDDVRWMQMHLHKQASLEPNHHCVEHQEKKPQIRTTANMPSVNVCMHDDLQWKGPHSHLDLPELFVKLYKWMIHVKTDVLVMYDLHSDAIYLK